MEKMTRAIDDRRVRSGDGDFLRIQAYLALRLAEELERCKRYRHFVSVLSFALDEDISWEKALELVERNIRRVDIAGRFDRWHLLIILPETPEEGARVVGRRVVAHLEALTGRKEIGFGCAVFPGDGTQPYELIEMAIEESTRIMR